VIIAHGFQGFGMPTRTSSFDVPFPFALPFFRIILHGGFLAVAIFFVLSGYVCSMKPLKLALAGKPEEARRNIASSAFRRVVRLVVPATIATTISWILANIGAYNTALSLDGWLAAHSHDPSYSFISAIYDLGQALVPWSSKVRADDSYIHGITTGKYSAQRETITK
jgi:peptidoglycan/LPS O-acetylase OafA/YrhL